MPVKLGICGSNLCGEGTGTHGTPVYEVQEMLDSGREIFDEVLLIDPRDVTYALPRGVSVPSLLFGKREISDLACLVVRAVRGFEEPTALLVHSLHAAGCIILDPISRFNASLPTKTLTSFDRFCRQVGTTSWFVFSRESAESLLEQLSRDGVFPLMAKPTEGRQGQGVTLLSDHDGALAYTEEFFREDAKRPLPLLIQRYMPFSHEYRVMIVGEQLYGPVVKEALGNGMPANAARGSKFSVVDAPHVTEFVQSSRRGCDGAILGVDVGEVGECQELHIIEENYSPGWREFDRATGLNMAKEIIENARSLCSDP